jgi:hypothetical protein
MNANGPYAPPNSLFPYTVSGTHPIMGSIEFGVVSLENANEKAEELRKDRYQDVTVVRRP